MRNPHRVTPEGKNIIAPADGRIIDIIPFSNNSVELYKGNTRALGVVKTTTSEVAQSGYIVSIFMTPLDVHYNRAPIAGSVQQITHQEGRFRAANSMNAFLENEKTELLISSGLLKVKMIQVAGFLARRIETFVEPNTQVKKGQVVGVIKLGSQVTLILPKNITFQVQSGQRVIAGETILAKINS